MSNNSLTKLMALANQDLENAQLLLDNNRHRASISRAYYAMFYSTQALLKVKNIPNRTHKGMIKQFGQHFVKTGELPTDMARGLGDNHDLRHLSDYEEDVVLNEGPSHRSAGHCY